MSYAGDCSIISARRLFTLILMLVVTGVAYRGQ